MKGQMKKLTTLFALLLLCGPAWADDDGITILNAATGTWSGELYYLDYQSGERFGIPLTIEAETTPDGATLIRRFVFTDPGVLVHAVSLATVDRETGQLVEAYFREGRSEYLRYTVTEQVFNAEDDWRIVYEQEGVDNDRPAMIRNTMKRNGANMSSTKEVRFLDESPKYFVRNGTEITLQD